MNKPFYMYMNVQGMGRNVLVCLITILLFVSCQSYKKVPYLQDAEIVEQAAQQENLYDAKIMPKDLLTIVVSCTSPELAVPFNLTVASPGSVVTGNTQLTTQPVLQPYLVVSTIPSAFTYSSCCCSVFYNFMFRETNLKRDKNGTKPQENKVRNTIELHAPTVGITLSCTKVQICPVKTEQFYLFLSLTNTFSDYCTTRDNTSTFYIPVYPFSEYVYVKQCFHSFGQ